MEIDVFDEIQRLRQEGRKTALATIVQIRGLMYDRIRHRLAIGPLRDAVTIRP